jgi:CspA family cold shock protein
MSNFGALQTGRVKFFNDRGWGYITPSDGTRDVWFHCSDLPGKRGQRTIEEGTPVSYRIGPRTDRINAIEVRPLALEVEETPASETNEVE